MRPAHSFVRRTSLTTAPQANASAQIVNTYAPNVTVLLETP
jgi:hypothetical protein